MIEELRQKAIEYRKRRKQEIIDDDDFEKLSLFDENVEEAYIASVEENGIQWHDLRKDSYDLPDLETELLCQKPTGRCFVGYYKDNKFYSHETGMAYVVVRWADIGVFWRE